MSAKTKLCSLAHTERMNTVETLCIVLQRENQELREKTERLENFSHILNIRVFGLNKDTEKRCHTEFMVSVFKLFKDKNLPCQPEMEIAHRASLQ